MIRTACRMGGAACGTPAWRSGWLTLVLVGCAAGGDGRADGCDAFDRIACVCPGGGVGVRACAAGGVCRCDVPAGAAGGRTSTLSVLATIDDVVPFPADQASHVFAENVVRTYELEVALQDLASIDAAPADEQYVPAMLRFEGRTIGPIGLRYKGSVGAFQPPCTRDGQGPKTGKCSVKLSFNWSDREGTFYGLRKLNFHSMNHDPSMLRERLAYRLFRDVGAPASRSVHARLVVNGEPWGLFALVEQVDGRFTRSRFSEGGKGNLYKEVWPRYDEPAPYLSALETNEDEQPSVARMQAFKWAIDEGAEAMAAWLDTSQLMNLIAADRVMINDDGLFHFWCTEGGQGSNLGESGNHNYYWYEATDDDHFWIIPWDMDLAFDATPGVRLDWDWRAPGPCDCGGNRRQTAPSCDRMIQQWASWPDAYARAVDAFVTGPFRKSRIDAMLDEWAALIAPYAAQGANIGGALNEAGWRRGVDQLKRTIDGARRNRGLRY